MLFYRKSQSFFSALVSSMLWRVSEKTMNLLKHIVVTSYFGLSIYVDVFYMLIALMGVLVFSWSYWFSLFSVPKLVLLANENTKVFRQTVGQLGLFCLCLGVLAFLMVLIAAKPLSALVFWSDQARQQLLESGLYWISGAILLYPLYFFLQSANHAVRHFYITYQSEFFLSALVLVVILLFPSHHVLFWSLSLAVFLSSVLIIVRSKTLWGKPTGLFQWSPFKKLFHNSHYFFFFGAFESLFILSDRAFSTIFSAGVLSGLAYGLLLAIMALKLFENRSFLVILSEKKTQTEKNNTLNQALLLYTLLGVSFFTIILITSKDLVTVLFERGLFSSKDTQIVHRALLGYITMGIPVLGVSLFLSVAQIEQKMKWMTLNIVLALLLNIALNALFLFVFQLGFMSIVVATSVSYWIMLALCGWTLKNQNYTLRVLQHLRWALWLLVFFLPLLGVQFILENSASPLFRLGINGTLWLLLLFCAGYLNPFEEGKLFRKYSGKIKFKRPSLH